MNNQMENHFIKKTWRHIIPKHHRPFSICIMDEASQCVEPEALIPLKLGFMKMVMVGDPAQLPATVSSLAAKQQNFSISLFARLFKHFEFAEDSPIQHLYTQYRMASDIMAWPNQYFYGGKLKCGSQDRRCPIINYKLMNLEDSQQECHGSLIGNPGEAKFVAGLAKYVKRELERADQGHKSVGILTFYNRQRRLILDELRKLRVPFL